MRFRSTAARRVATALVGILLFAVAIPRPSAAETNAPATAGSPGPVAVARPRPASPAPTVGMEGRLEVALPGTLLEAVPVDERSTLILRLADTRPHGRLIWYDLRFIGLVPGRHDLRGYLRRRDGSPTNDLPELPVEVIGLLPPTHRGELIEQPRGLLRWFGGYRNALVAAGVAWGLALVPLWWLGRKRASPVGVAAPPPAPTLAERLRPLVEQAAAGRLSTDGKAQLERLLLAHWCERLQLGELKPADAMARLREHREAGALLRALEDWLHRPPGAAHVDIAALLAPYRVPPPPGGTPSGLPRPFGTGPGRAGVNAEPPGGTVKPRVNP